MLKDIELFPFKIDDYHFGYDIKNYIIGIYRKNLG